jgi:hypothetical protein
MKRLKPNWLVAFCVGLGHVIERKIEERIKVTGRRRKRSKLLLDELKEKRRFRELKKVALDRTTWRTPLERVSGPVIRQTVE